MVTRGDLADPAWRRAFEEVPRHEFVPLFYDKQQNPVSRHQPEQVTTWLAEVYTDEALATQLAEGIVVSSSSQPSLMAIMLEALRLEGNERVLEIGTGTGYNAALLCHRLGEYRVVTIDVDPDITSLARSRLADVGYQPLVATGNGLEGYEGRAPYQRIIATVGLEYVPTAWLEQLTPGGLVVAPLGAGVIRLENHGDGTAIQADGRFLRTPAYFMPLRGVEVAQNLVRPDLPTGMPRPTDVRASVLTGNSLRFLTSLLMPRFVYQYDVDTLDAHGKPTAARIWSVDGSIAEVRGDEVLEAGPTRLWSRLEEIRQIQLEHGKPERDRFGLTVDADGQRLWLDDPDGPSWPLAVPPAGSTGQ
ncbi:methyltransferase domain-containing protein [Kribbella deserti]|uniref:Protein-L-isoaspartate O-methyltransferase n=1 Tax=Kribbella deserti TaxID=1926257 RepID=A0ABV6QI12_9ACTN